MAGAAPRSTTSCASSTTFPGAKVVRLERNYRSTGHILAAASHLIANNAAASARRCSPTTSDGDRVKVRGVWDGEAEARLIADDIEALAASATARYAECAVLVRASWQMRAFEERFLDAAHPLQGDRRPALLRARRSPRRARLSAPDPLRGRRPRLRAHRQPAQARHRRTTVQKLHAHAGKPPCASSPTTARCSTPTPAKWSPSSRAPAARRASARCRRGARTDAHRRAAAESPHGAARFLSDLDRWRDAIARRSATSSWPKSSSTRAATPTCCAPTNPRRRRPGSRT